MSASLRERMELWREDEDTTGQPILLIRVRDSDSEETIRSIEAAGATVEETLGFNFLRVTYAEESIEDLESIDSIESIEIEAQGETLDEGNFRSQANTPL